MERACKTGEYKVRPQIEVRHDIGGVGRATRGTEGNFLKKTVEKKFEPC